jgi:hypothetical protein
MDSWDQGESVPGRDSADAERQRQPAGAQPTGAQPTGAQPADGQLPARAQQTGGELTGQVAELAGELSEASTEPQRRRLTSAIARLASRTRQAGWRGLQLGGQAGLEGARQSGRIGLQGARYGGRAGLEGARQSGRLGLQGARYSGRIGVQGARRGGEAGWQGLRYSGRWLTAETMRMAPRIPVRSQQRLRGQFPGRSPDELADTLIQGAARASAGVGATVGAAMLLPAVPTAGVEIAVETLALVAIEIKLIAELHEVYGLRPPGPVTERMLSYLVAWAHRRGVGLAPGGLVLAVGSPLHRRIERRLLARAGRSAASLGPLLTGALAGAVLNRRETIRLGRQIQADLQARSQFAARWPD